MKILEELKKNWKFYTITNVSIILIILLMTYMVNISDKLYKKIDYKIGDSYVEDIDTDTTITQKFIAEYNNLEKLYIEFEPFKDSSNVGGDVLIGVRDEDGNIIKEEKITRNYIRENTTYKLKFKKQKLSQGKEYELYIKFVDHEKYDKFYTVKYSKENKIENYKLLINGVEEEGTISFAQLYSNNKKLFTAYKVMR